ncbi:hypothetical protein BKA93DRAFT_848112 [Sparassis latifolia]
MMSSSVWNYTIDDSSSYLTYTPHGDGGIGDWTHTGWQPWYSESGGWNTAGGNYATGTSLHITSFPGASVELQFYGTSIYVFGTSNSSYNVALDSSISSNLTPLSGDLLFMQEGLSRGTHFLNLTARPESNSSQQLALDSLIISQKMAKDESVPIPVIYDNMNASLLYRGNWSVPPLNNQIPNTTDPKPYHETAFMGASVSLNFTGIAIAINGTRNWGNGIYNVTLDGISTQYNGSTMWLVSDALLFYQSGLNADQTHTLELISTAPNSYNLWLNSITAFAPNITTPNPRATGSAKKTNVGVIVGPIIGAIAALLLLGAAFWWWRRSRRVRAYGSEGKNLTPFIQPTTVQFIDPSAPYDAPHDAASSHAASSIIALSSMMYEKDRSVRTLVSPTGATQASSISHIPSSIPPESQVRPLTVPSAQPPAPAQQPVDVDHIIELIAGRIDRSQAFDPSSPPPQYQLGHM